MLSRLTNKARLLLTIPSIGVAATALGLLFTAQSQALPEEPPIVAAIQDTKTPKAETIPLPPAKIHRAPFHGTELTAFGDSVLLGASPVLKKEIPGAKVYAKVSKQAGAVLKEVQDMHDSRTLTPYVLVHLGTNGYVTEKQLRSILGLLKEQKRVVLMNTKVPRQWAKANNQLMDKISTEYPNVVLANWNLIADHHPEFFVSDGVHLTVRGQQAFVSGIKAQLQTPSAENESGN